MGEPGNEHFLPDDPWTWSEPLLWDDVETGEPFNVSARTLVNTLGCRSWADVVDYMQGRHCSVSWWENTETMEVAKRHFDEYLNNEQMR